MDGMLQFLLLQMNDALFPIGGYSHSYGLETYIQKGLVHNPSTAADYLRASLRESFLYGDLLCARLAWERGTAGDCAGLLSLEEIACTSKSPRELREAANKIGSRFVKTVAPLLPVCGCDNTFLSLYTALLTDNGNVPSHAAAYGACCGAIGIPKDAAMRAFLYAQASAMVTCCVKTVPLSQTAGQRLLTALFGLLEDLLEDLELLEEDDLYRTAPGFDIRAMEHETLYSRLYMS